MTRIKKTPTILQMEAVECGAAALAIIMAYYGKYVPLTELRAECGISRDGSRAINILKAARRYGMKAQAAEVDRWQAVFELTLPCIAFWNFNHFVVIEGIHKNKIYINDPAFGPHVISIDEFDHAFTGVILLLEPKLTFQPGGKPFSLVAAIKKRLEGQKPALSYILIISLALVIPGVVIPGLSKIFVDDILIKKIPHWFIPLLIGMAITALLRAIFSWLQQLHLLRFQTKLLLKSSMQFLWHVLHLPMAFFSHRYIGDIAERVAANNRIAELISGEVSSSIVSLISTVFYAVVILLISWPLGLFGIGIVLINITLLYYISQHLSNMSYRYLQEKGKLSGVEMNGLQVIETLKASGAENSFFNLWSGLHSRTLNSSQQITIYSGLLQIIPQFMTTLTTLTILGLGGYLVMRGQLSLGDLVALQSLFISFNSPLQTLLVAGGELPKIRGDFARLEDVLQHPLDQRFSNNSLQQNKLQGELNIANLTFGYSPLDPPLIKNFSLVLKPNERVAIVGATGSGKSTLAKLIANLYQPWSGRIEFAGKALTELSPIQIAQSIALVDQDIFLFEGTVRDNIALWNKTISDKDIERALFNACISEDIITRGGLEIEVREKGNNFSGGQRQRLEIARALVGKPSLLILDEATSALDPIVEIEILNRLKEQGHALLIITHRLSAIRDCEHIIVLNEGRISQQGNHKKLIQQEGVYRRMYQLV